MSGRKSSEVYAVLNRVNSGLEQNLRARQANCNGYQKQEQQILGRINAIQSQGIMAPVLTFANKRFRAETQEKLNQLENQKQSIAQLKVMMYQSQLASNRHAIDNIQTESEQISQSVSGHDYNNQQYANAVSLEQKLNQTMQKISEDERLHYQHIETLRHKLQQLEQHQREAEAAKLALKQLEEQAQFLEQQEQEANALRDKIYEKLNNFDESLLDNFIPMELLKNRYTEKKVEFFDFVRQTDAMVIQDFSRQLQSLEELQRNICLEHQKYRQQQQTLLLGIQDFEQIISQKKYIHCLSGQENCYTLSEFLAENGIPLDLQLLNKMLKSIKELGEKHNFTAGLESLSQLNAEYQKMHDQVIGHQERIQNMYCSAKRAQDAMNKLSFDTSLEYMGNGTPYDGLKLVASYGEDVIHFESEYDDNGNFKTFSINHLDKKGNDAIGCERSWGEIRDAMANEGLYVHQIYKDGQSVIHEKTRQATAQQAKTSGKTATQ